MPTITFDEPGLGEGRVSTITRDGVTVRFLGRVDIVRSPVPTLSGNRVLANTRQDPTDESGWQIPVAMEFDRLQRSVGCAVGLAERDWSVDRPEAFLRAYDAAGTLLAESSTPLGTGPSPVTTTLQVDVGGDAIRRAVIEYNGVNREYIDNLTFLSDGNPTVPPDTLPPTVMIDSPGDGEDFSGRLVPVRGRVHEAGPVTLAVNGVAVALLPAGFRPDGLIENWRFDADVPIDAAGVILAVATDAAGNVGTDTATVVLREPATFSVAGVVFSQTGLLDPGDPQPSRRVAGKTMVVKLRAGIRTAGGDPASVDSAALVVDAAGATTVVPGLLAAATGTGFRSPDRRRRVRDGDDVYFVVPGRDLAAGPSHSFRIRLLVGATVVSEQPLASGWVFQETGPLNLLIVPQHRSMGPVETRGLVNALAHLARMYPVRDGLGELGRDNRAGVRFAVLPPQGYAGHTDPNDDPAIDYEQGFLLHDHLVGIAPLQDNPGPTDGNRSLWAGEYLSINFGFPEDIDNDGSFGPTEVARAMAPPGPNPPPWPALRRIDNWITFSHGAAEQRRVSWNRERSWFGRDTALRAIVTPTGSGPFPLNRTGLLGQGSSGWTTMWANVDRGGSPVVAHELTHTVVARSQESALGLNGGHSACTSPNEGVDVLTWARSAPSALLMCPGVGRSSAGYFLDSQVYGYLFDRLRASGLSQPGGLSQAAAGEAAGDRRVLAMSAVVGLDGSARLVASQLVNVSGEQVDPLPGGDVDGDSRYLLVVLDAAGQPLAEAPLAVSFTSPALAEKLPSAFVTGTVAWAEGAAGVELRSDDAALLKWAPPSAPLELSGADAKLTTGRDGAEAVVVTWAGAGALTYDVECWFDAGKRFVPVAGPLSGASVEIDAAELPEGEVTFRVTASDGFATVTASSGALTLAERDVLAVIVAPEPGARVEASTSLACHGLARVPGRGLLPDSSLQWLLVGADGVRPLGSGREAVAQDLKPGKYQLALVATASGRQASDSIEVEVWE